ncbi:MAG: biotin/lipoyl-binding protein [Planctomycetota bacterium]
MSETSRHRSDLSVVGSLGSRTCIVIDDVAGTFTRVRRSVWDTWQRSGEAPDLDAASMGWLKQRNLVAPRTSTGKWSRCLSIRMPLFNIDRIAHRWIPISGLWFSAAAIACWLMAGFLTATSIAVRWEQLSGGLPMLATFMASLHPLSMGVIFVSTKVAHELGHAVLCRRLGNRCGDFGIWWFCGMPCPFVDVTDVWREPNRWRRAAVMSAGMWVEWTIAIVASWVWLVSKTPSTQLMALQVMLVCGVSTLIFNANPLMRYDGYYILSDWLDAANLRQDARRSFSMAFNRLMDAKADDPTPWSTRMVSMTCFHMATTIYRYFITFAIIGLALTWSDFVHLRRGLILLLSLAAVWVVLCCARHAAGTLRGKGRWRVIPRRRRLLFVTALGMMGIFTVFFPLPRWHTVGGHLRVANAIDVFLPGEGILSRVSVRVGDRVKAGQLLAEVDDASLRLELAEIQGRQAILTSRIESARLASLRSSAGEVARQASQSWDLLQSASQSLSTTRTSLDLRRQAMRVESPMEGVILAADSSDEGQTRLEDPFRLQPNVGEASRDDHVWCRVASGDEIHIELTIDSTLQSQINPGDSVQIWAPTFSDQVIPGRVGAISPLRPTTRATDESAPWQGDRGHSKVICVLVNPPRFDARAIHLDGSVCDATLSLPPRRLIQEIWTWFAMNWAG